MQASRPGAMAARARTSAFGAPVVPLRRGGLGGGAFAPSLSRSRSTAVTVRASVFEKFSERSIRVLMLSQQHGKELGSAEVTTEHVLLGLVAEDAASRAASSPAPSQNQQQEQNQQQQPPQQHQPGYLGARGVTVERVRAAAEAIRGRRRPNLSPENLHFSREVRRAFEAAASECRRSGVAFVAPEHIALALLSAASDTAARAALAALGVHDVEPMRREARRRVAEAAAADAAAGSGGGPVGGAGAARRRAREAAAAAAGGQGAGAQKPTALEEFCRDLCAEARAGRIDPVIGREREVARVMQVLGRRTKNNPILLGDPGVGKTAIAEGLAYCIVHGTAPSVAAAPGTNNNNSGAAPSGGGPLPAFLRDKRVLQLDVGLLIAGAKERGELESRVTRLMQEIREAGGNVILMIDEVHTLVGAGSLRGGGGGGGGGGGLDVSNMLKPALARGELQCIGATTVDEHRRYVERDPALERRFQPVYVLEPDEAQTLDILKGLSERYERHHRCVYAEEALEAAVALSSRYIQDRRLPDKAIDVVDEAGSRARIAAYEARRRRRRAAQNGSGNGSGNGAASAASSSPGSPGASSSPSSDDSAASVIIDPVAPVSSLSDRARAGESAAEDVAAAAQAAVAAAKRRQQQSSSSNSNSNNPDENDDDLHHQRGKVLEYLQVAEHKERAAQEGLFEEAEILSRRWRDYRAELSGPAHTGAALPVVGAAEVEAVVAAWSGVPVEQMTEGDRERLARLAPHLKKRVLGQSDAADAVAAALARARCGLGDPRRPVASLLFVGPTGVGKTELARALAEAYYGGAGAAAAAADKGAEEGGDADDASNGGHPEPAVSQAGNGGLGGNGSLIRLDMSEYMERHAVAKLIGAPPGYVGYGEGGKLTEAVRRRPCSIVLFDEIEKAHPDVFSILLQVMEDGRLTDSAGRVVSFKHALVILTSNVGSRVIASSNSGANGGRVFGSGGGGNGAEAPSRAMAPRGNGTSSLSLAERAARDAAQAGGASRPPESSSSSGSDGEDQLQQQQEDEEAEVAAMRAAASASGDDEPGSDGEAVSDGEGESADERAAQKARLEQLVLDEVKSYFRPELLNRFDQVVVFHRLQRRHVRKIARLLLAETVRRAAARGVALSVGPRLLARAVGEGHSDEYGARPLRQALTHLVDDVLAEAVLSGRVRKGGSAHVELAPPGGGAEAADGDTNGGSASAKAPVAGEPYVYASEADAEAAHARAAERRAERGRRVASVERREYVPESAKWMV